MKLVILTLLWLLANFCHASAGEDPKTGEKILNSNGIFEQQLSRMLNEFSETPDDGRVCNSIGFYLYKLGKYQPAIEYYKKAIALSPEYPISYNNLGVLYLKENQLQLAEGNFKKAIELEPKYVKAICNLALVCYKLQKYDEARRLYYRAKIVNSEYVTKRISCFQDKAR